MVRGMPTGELSEEQIDSEDEVGDASLAHPPHHFFIELGYKGIVQKLDVENGGNPQFNSNVATVQKKECDSEKPSHFGVWDAPVNTVDVCRVTGSLWLLSFGGKSSSVTFTRGTVS
jgi:hypothetical protein